MKLDAIRRALCLTTLCPAMVFCAGTILPAAAFAQESTPMSHAVAKSAEGSVNKQADGTAVKGYDVVAYFQDQKAAKGNPDISYQYKGATYDFISAAHRSAFIQNPESYLPQYGGYCAFGTSKGHKANIDPESWAVVDGKLYLNSSPGAQKLFDKDPHAAIKHADTNWQQLK